MIEVSHTAGLAVGQHHTVAVQEHQSAQGLPGQAAICLSEIMGVY